MGDKKIEIAKRFTSAAELWDGVADVMVAANRDGWTPARARKVQNAARMTAAIATAGELKEVAAAWRIAAAAWEGAADQLEGGSEGSEAAKELDEATGEFIAAKQAASKTTPPPTMLSSQTIPAIMSLSTSTLIELFVGSGVAFSMLRFCSRGSSMSEAP